MHSQWQVIHLYRGAPAKPHVGATCNGCGVCCATEPCPLGMVLSGRRGGACAALRWDETQVRYLCGAISAPRTVLPRSLGLLAPLLGRLARRWISAGHGCDAAVSAKIQEPGE